MTPPRYSATALCQSEAGATKFQRQFDVQPTATDIADFQAETSGLHRRLYGEWPSRRPGVEVKDPQGQVVPTPRAQVAS